MAIPIKCAGCQAAFDVPDNLTGKTIRCTSCKTQLTVPAPAAVATAAAATPVAKPAKKIVVDDEADNKKSKPKDAKSKSAARRRDDEDDEDEDDDDDDRPRRGKAKKAAKGGSGGMIALIAAGAVGLAAIAGVSIWLLMGSSDKDDKKSASSSSSPAPTPGMPGPSPGMPGGPGGGPPRPGGAPTGGIGQPGWQEVKGQGFTCQMPGEPQIMNQNGMKLHVLDKKTSAFSASVVDLGGDGEQVTSNAALRANLFDKMAAGMLNQSAGGVNFKTNGNRDVTQDGLPAREVTLTGSGRVNATGTIRLVAGRTTVYMFVWMGEGSSSDGQTFFSTVKLEEGTGGLAGGPMPTPGVGVGPGSYPTPGVGGGPPPMAGVITPGFPMPTPGTGVGPGGPPPGMTPPKGIPGGPPPGMIPPMGIPGGPPPGMIPPMGVPGGPAPTPGVGGPPMPGGPFPGPGGPPMGFPGGPGMAGGPGMGGTGIPGQAPPPAGAATRPEIAGKLQPFHAFAFDTDRNEFYTVAERQDTKSHKKFGELRRYAYPDFKKSPAIYNLPALATRAAIDSKNGLLYLATATNQNQMRELEYTQFDRSSAHGDVQVFDLKAIQDGKVAEGADLKPLGTLTIGGSIRGLELTNDGKFLLVAVNRSVPGGQPKAFIRKYEAAERKFVKEISLPTQVAEVHKSGDGTKLVAVEFDSTLRKTRTSITMVDPVTLETGKPILAPGVATDAAVIADGKGIAVAVTGSPNQPGNNGGIGGPPGPGGIGGPPAIGGPGAGPPAIGGPPGVGGPPGGGRPVSNTPQMNFVGSMHFIESGETKDFPIGAWLASHNNYARFTPDGKHLLVSSIAGNLNGRLHFAGLDVYVPDEKDGSGFKKIASIRDAIRVASPVQVGGWFDITPDGGHVVFRNGAVLALANIDKNASNAGQVPEAGGGSQAGGFPGGAPMPGVGPPGFPGGAPMPGGGPGRPAAPGGVVPPGGFVQPGGGGMVPMPGVVAPPGGFVPPGAGSVRPAAPGGGAAPATPGFQPGGAFEGLGVAPGAGVPAGALPAAPAAAGEKIDSKKLVGKWQLKPEKSDNKDDAMLMEFGKDGKVTEILVIGGKEEKGVMPYKVDGNTLTIADKVGNREVERKSTITRLTDTELVVKSKSGGEDTFVRLKGQ